MIKMVILGIILLFNTPPPISDNTPDLSFVSQQIPKSLFSHNSFPNPFNPSTQLRFGVPKNAEVVLRIVSIDGRLISSSSKIYTAGYHNVAFDGSQLSSGLYIAQFQFKSEDGTAMVKTIKMNLLK